MSRSWYVISDNVEHKCDFISVNTLRCWVWLKLNGRAFKVVFLTLKDYQYAKRGEPVRAHATNKTTHKICKIVFK